MDISDKVKEVMSGAKPDHAHSLLSDTWQQVVHRIGPKIAKMVWEAAPDGLKENLGGWTKELFQVVSLLVAQALPNKGIAQMIDALQVEVAAELHELASSYKKGEPTSDATSARTKTDSTGSGFGGALGSHQILRLELEFAEKVISWLACAVAAGIDSADIVKFLDGLTLRELRTFAQMDEAAKTVYVEAVLGHKIPKVNSESLWKKISERLGVAWEATKDCASKVNSDLEEIAEAQDAITPGLERTLVELKRPPGKWDFLMFWKL